MKYDNPYKCIAPECIEENIAYAFSLNPIDSLQYWDDDNRLNKFKTNLTTILSSLNTINVIANIELSPLGRLHLHGTIKILNTKLFFLNHIHKLQHYGTFEIDTIKDQDKWTEYINKQSKLTLGSIQTQKLIGKVIVPVFKTKQSKHSKPISSYSNGALLAEDSSDESEQA